MEANVPGLNVSERCSGETLHRSFEAELCSGSRLVPKAKMNTFVKKAGGQLLPLTTQVWDNPPGGECDTFVAEQRRHLWPSCQLKGHLSSPVLRRLSALLGGKTVAKTIFSECACLRPPSYVVPVILLPLLPRRFPPEHQDSGPPCSELTKITNFAFVFDDWTIRWTTVSP